MYGLRIRVYVFFTEGLKASCLHQVKGEYVAYSKVQRGSKGSRDMQCAQELWKRSLQIAEIPENQLEAG